MKAGIVKIAVAVARRLKGREFASAVVAGDRARDARQWPEAARHYRRAVIARPDVVTIAVQLGHALKESGDFVGAESAYRKFLTVYPKDADIHLQVGHLFWIQSRYDESTSWYQLALALDAQDGGIARDAKRALAEISTTPHKKQIGDALKLTDERNWREACSALTDLVERLHCEELVGILANVSKEAGLFDQAEIYYRRYREFAAEKSADLRFDAELQSGHFEKLRGDPSAALSHYLRARRFFPETHAPSCSKEQLMPEINYCLREVCAVLEPL